MLERGLYSNPVFHQLPGSFWCLSVENTVEGKKTLKGTTLGHPSPFG